MLGKGGGVYSDIRDITEFFFTNCCYFNPTALIAFINLFAHISKFIYMLAIAGQTVD